MRCHRDRERRGDFIEVAADRSCFGGDERGEDTGRLRVAGERLRERELVRASDRIGLRRWDRRLRRSGILRTLRKRIGRERIGLRARVEPVPADGEPANGSAPGTLLVSKRDVMVATGSGPVLLTTVQPHGKKAMAAADWARGVRVAEGERVGDA